ncbi:MAG: PHB depolymerase family esterase [Blastocatellia bacterium]
MTAGRVLIILMTSGLMLTWPARAQQDVELFQNRAITIGATEYHFRVFVPRGWTRKKKSPVILFLHGAGERGADNLAQTRVGIGPAILRQQETLSTIVVLPQCPRNRWWSEREMQTLALAALNQTVKEFNGDASRIYLTGLSMGGYGSWAIVANKGGARFAALAVVCGGVRPPPGISLPKGAAPELNSADPYADVAAKVGKIPVWVFHGGADPVVPVSESRKMVEALKAGGNVRYNEYEGVGHNSWDRAYAETEIFEWMLAQRLKASKQ